MTFRSCNVFKCFCYSGVDTFLKNVFYKNQTIRVGGKRVRENSGRGWAKVKYTHSGDTLRNPFEHHLKY
jgi:hypothetical protein